MKLKEICKIRTGYSFKSKVMDIGGEVKVIQPKDISDGEINSFSQNPSLDFNALPNHILCKGEVLIANKGTRFTTLVFDKEDDFVASSSFFVIKIEESIVDPYYLNWYLGEPPALNYLNLNVKGSAQPSLSKKSLGELPIELPKLELQIEIRERIMAVRHEEVLYKQLIERRKKLLHTKSWNQILNAKK